MPITVALEEDGRVIRGVLVSPINADDLDLYFAQTQVYYDAAKAPLHGLLNLHGVSTMIPGLIDKGAQSPALTHTMAGLIAVIGAGTTSRLMVEVVLRVVRFTRIKFFSSEAEALAYLRHLIATENEA
jgi:hypothetical protein